MDGKPEAREVPLNMQEMGPEPRSSGSQASNSFLSAFPRCLGRSDLAGAWPTSSTRDRRWAECLHALSPTINSTRPECGGAHSPVLCFLSGPLQLEFQEES